MTTDLDSLDVGAGRQERDFLAKGVLFAEWFALFALLPAATAWFRFLGQYRLLVLLAATAWVGAIVWRAGATRSELGMREERGRGFWGSLRLGGALWLVTSVLTVILHSTVLSWPTNPPFWTDSRLVLLVPCLYIGSVLSQEFAFRSFFFWRYRGLFPGWSLILLNALAFSWVHIVYHSWVPVLVTFPAGLGFAILYSRYKSFWGVCWVHFIFGMTVFATGYGNYFYLRRPL